MTHEKKNRGRSSIFFSQVDIESPRLFLICRIMKITEKEGEKFFPRLIDPFIPRCAKATARVAVSVSQKLIRGRGRVGTRDRECSRDS